jgi:SWI/SNF-related matrix-associated actin-dependent regulator of chromatin subfamily A3
MYDFLPYNALGTNIIMQAPILPLRLLVFTPRGNMIVVANYFSQAQLYLDHPSIPYDPSHHRDNPMYDNPHNPPPGGFRTALAAQSATGRWNQQVVAGKSVEVQRSQVDEVFKSLRSGEELEETEPGW